MATAVRNLTKMGTDVRKIAALLKAKAPEGHMLAYISPEEAQLLKDRGGSGKPHADTGIPSFELDDDLAIGGAAPATKADPAGMGGTSDEYGMPGTGGGAQLPESQFGGLYPAPPAQTQQTTFQPQGPSYAGAPVDQGGGYDFAPGTLPAGAMKPADLTSPAAAALQARGAEDLKLLTQQPEAPKGKSIEDVLGSKLGVAGITGLLGALQARKAGQAGQQGAQDIQKLATPYQQTGQQLQAQAQAGTLTPAGQQSLQALQAQVAQGVQARGGVGAQQAQAAVEQLRQQLLQQQYDYGLKLSGIGDNIAIGAIKTGMQADQYANQLTSSYFNNIARIAAGTPTATPQVGVTA
jgi:hypothetical protein